MILRIHEFLHCLDKITAGDVVNEVEHNEWYAKLEMNQLNELLYREEGLALLRLHHLVLLMDEVAEEWLPLVLGVEAGGAPRPHLLHKNLGNRLLLDCLSVVVLLLDLLFGFAYLTIDLFNFLFVGLAVGLIPVGVRIDLALFLFIGEYRGRQ